MVDLKALTKSIDDLTAEVAQTEGTEESARKLIVGVAAEITKAVTDALTADAAANEASITAAASAIATVTGRFVDARGKLGAAVASA